MQTSYDCDYGDNDHQLNKSESLVCEKSVFHFLWAPAVFPECCHFGPQENMIDLRFML